MGERHFSIPRLGYEGELPEGLPKADFSGLLGDENIAPGEITLPRHASFGPVDSKRPVDTEPPVAEKTE